MSLYLVTGSSATGKSTVCKLLKKMGYEAFDTDDDGLARWINKDTGYIHRKSSIKSYHRTKDFIENNIWSVPQKVLIQLDIKDKPVFICGSLGNEDKLINSFDKIFALYVDEDELIKRLLNRSNNDWGKQEHELEQTLRHHRRIYKEYRKRGNIIINGTLPVKEIVKNILSSINNP